MPEQPSPRSILVIKPSSLGDIVHTLPAVVQLKRAHPGARITWMVNPEWAPLLEENPAVDEILIFPRRDFSRPSKWPSLLMWLQTVWRLRPDAVCDFQGLLRSGLLARICRGKIVYGLSDAREGARFFYRCVADVASRGHAVQRYLTLAQLLGGSEQSAPEFPLPPGKKPPGFTIREPFVLLHPFSRGPGKSLQPTEVITFCEAMKPLPVVLVGRMREAVVPPVSNCTDLLNATTLHELIWLVRRAAFSVSVDSGPMHIAAAITDKMLSIHTWSDPKLVGPYNPTAWVWKDDRVIRMKDYDDRSNAGMPITNMAQVAAFVRGSVATPAATNRS